MVGRLAIAVLAAFFFSNVAGCSNNVDGIPGVAADNISVCCVPECADVVCNESGCKGGDTVEGCCPSEIAASDEYCDAKDAAAPCITGNSESRPAPVEATTAPEGTPSPLAGDNDVIDLEDKDASMNDEELGDDDDGTSVVNADGSGPEGSTVAIIVLALLLSTLVVGLAAWCLMCRRKAPPASSIRRRDPGILAELGKARKDLANERNRRARAEALVYRAKGGGIRPGEFPSVRDVFQGVDQLTDDALTWTEKACTIGGSDAALPLTLQSVLESTFVVCREEAELCLERRLQSLSEFLGNQEPVLLSGGDSMNLDTQYVLYECLCRNYESIVPVGPDDMIRLARAVVERCQGSQDLAQSIISGDAWYSFEDLMENYMMVFVEMALQKPRMEFEDNLGKQVAFTPVTYRDWAPYCKAPVGQQCRIVFPVLLAQEGRPKPDGKIGVVRVSP